MIATTGRWLRSPLLLGSMLTALALALRLPSWGNSLFGDEVGSFFIVRDHSYGGILHLLDGHSVDLTPPLYYLLSHLAAGLGRAPQWLRLVPLLAGTAAVPLTLLVGRRTVGPRAAAVGALLLALSPFTIFYSTEARAYGLAMGLSILSTLALLEALSHRGTSRWALYGAVSCAGIYTHYTMVFVLAAQALWALARHPEARRPVILANLAAVAGFAPWLPALVQNSRSFGTQVFGILEPFGIHTVGRDLAHWTVGHPFLTLDTVPGGLGLGLICAGALIALSALAAHLGRHGHHPGVRQALTGPALLALLLALALPVGLALYSALGSSVWDLRNLSASTPGLALSAGLLFGTAGRRTGLLGAALVAAGLGVGAVKLLSPARQRPDYLAAAQYVLRAGEARATVAAVPAPTPGPLSAMDAAFSDAGAPGTGLLRVGSAPLAQVLAAAPYAPVAPTPPAMLAAQAIRRDGRMLFVIAPGAAPLQALLAGAPVDIRATLGPWFSTGVSGRLLSTIYPPLSAFLRATLSQYRPLATRVFPGLMKVSVYALQRRR